MKKDHDQTIAGKFPTVGEQCTREPAVISSAAVSSTVTALSSTVEYSLLVSIILSGCIYCSAITQIIIVNVFAYNMTDFKANVY